MSGFADLAGSAHAAYINGGVTDSLAAGRTYSQTFIDIFDNDGDPIDLSSVTGTCKVVAEDRTTVVLTLTFTGGLGRFTLSATKAATAGLYAGSDYSSGRVCYWYLILDDGTTSVQMWLVDNSKFTIRKGA